MKGLFTISLVVFSLILASTVQAGGILQQFYFIGLWEGIDNSDGSEAQRSITLNTDFSIRFFGATVLISVLFTPFNFSNF